MRGRNLTMLALALGGALLGAADDGNVSYEDMFLYEYVGPGVRVPETRPVVGDIWIDNRTFDLEEMLDRLLGEDRSIDRHSGFTRVIDQGSTIHRNAAQQEVEVYPHGGFIYRHPYIEGARISPVTRREAELILEQFVSLLGGLPPDAELVRTGDFKQSDLAMTNDALGLPLGYFFEYGRRHDGVLVRTDHIQINVIGNRLTFMSWSWGINERVTAEEDRAETIAATEAIRKAVEYVYREIFAGKYYADVWVSNIRLVYWYDGLEEAWRTDGPKRLAPVWEVDLNDGALRLVVHAHSGQVMKFF